jgi:large subunit ribosomal protein L19e
LSLKSQRRLAADLLKVGENRVWIDPNRTEDVEIAITRTEIRKLIHEGAIKQLPAKGVSRSRARVLHEKKKKGLRRGPGTKEGSSHAKITKKDAWMSRIRSLRKKLREWKSNRVVAEDNYRQLYMVAGSGAFSSIADMERYAKTHGMWRKR